MDMLTKRYLTSQKNVPAILQKIVEGAAPDKFTYEHLNSLGFTSSADRAIIPLLKDLGFLTPEGTPTPRYHAYRDKSRSKAVFGEALREAYADVFHISESPTQQHRAAIEGLFKSKHNTTDRVASLQASTFLTLLGNADVSASASSKVALPESLKREAEPDGADASVDEPRPPALTTELHYTIQVHLPPTKDIEVFNAIFRSLRENLLS
jgi:hypothetical protein